MLESGARQYDDRVHTEDTSDMIIGVQLLYMNGPAKTDVARAFQH
jgi:hypothetical protein